MANQQGHVKEFVSEGIFLLSTWISLSVSINPFFRLSGS